MTFMAASSVIRQSKRILARFYGSLKSPLCSCVSITASHLSINVVERNDALDVAKLVLLDPTAVPLLVSPTSRKDLWFW
jgi:hypothetical protein